MNLSRWTTLGLALAALGLGAGCQRSSDQYGSQSSKEGSSATQASQEIQGTVSQKSGDKLKVSDASGQEHTIKTNDKTQVFVGGQKTSGLEQIQEGSEIRASFPQKGEKEPALRIEVLPPGGGSQGGGSIGGQAPSGAGTGSQGGQGSESMGGSQGGGASGTTGGTQGGSVGAPGGAGSQGSQGTQGGSQGTQGGSFNQPSGAGQQGAGGSDTSSSQGGSVGGGQR